MMTASMTLSSVQLPFGEIERASLALRSNAFGKTVATTGSGALSKKDSWQKRQQRRLKAMRRDDALFDYLRFRNQILERYWAAQSLGGLGALLLRMPNAKSK